MTMYVERLTAVRHLLTQWQVDGLLITSPTNRRWLSGFTGSNGMLLVTPEEAWLSTDFRYWEQAQKQAPQFTLYHDLRADDDLLNFVKGTHAKQIAIEGEFMPVNMYHQLQTIDGIGWHPVQDTLEWLRASKTAEEIDAITQAAQITDQTMAQFPLIAQVGKTEKQLAWELEKTMRDAGASAPAFDIIVASGPNGAFPHHRPSDRQLQSGDAIIVDMGAQLNGYRSDLTRSFYLGSEPTAKFNEVYEVVLAAQTAVIQQLTPTITGKAVDSIARDYIASQGYGDYFGHGLGHGVGLDIHEYPRFSQMVDHNLEAGMIVTIEPGIYLPDWGGIRIEDLALLTPNGVKLISSCPKQPIIAQ